MTERTPENLGSREMLLGWMSSLRRRITGAINNHTEVTCGEGDAYIILKALDRLAADIKNSEPPTPVTAHDRLAAAIRNNGDTVEPYPQGQIVPAPGTVTVVTVSSPRPAHIWKEGDTEQEITHVFASQDVAEQFCNEAAQVMWQAFMAKSGRICPSNWVGALAQMRQYGLPVGITNRNRTLYMNFEETPKYTA